METYIVWVRGASGVHTHTYKVQAASLASAASRALEEHRDWARENGKAIFAAVEGDEATAELFIS
jgi:hypothetical protein